MKTALQTGVFEHIDYVKLGDGFLSCNALPCHPIEPSSMPNANNTQSSYVWSMIDQAYYYCADDSIKNTACAQVKEEDLPYRDYIAHSAAGWAKCQSDTLWTTKPGEYVPMSSNILDCRTMTIKDRLRYEPRKSDTQANAFRFASGMALYCNGTEISSCHELKLNEVPITREMWIPSWANSVNHM